MANILFRQFEHELLHAPGLRVQVSLLSIPIPPLTRFISSDSPLTSCEQYLRVLCSFCTIQLDKFGAQGETRTHNPLGAGF